MTIGGLEPAWIAAPVLNAAAMPVFRKRIGLPELGAGVRAIARVCGLGHFELRVNGAKAGEDVFEPAWSDYRKTCYVVTHDVSALLREGENVIEVLLGNGMYNVTGTRYRKFKGTFGEPRLWFEMDVMDAAGPRLTSIVSDRSWQVGAGPITFSCIYGGEDHDARREEPTDWRRAVETEGPGGERRPSIAPPVRAMRLFPAVRSTAPSPGVRVFDLGQNFSGWPRVSVRGASGATVKLITGELLDEHGRVTQKCTGSPVSFSYTLRGDPASESWHPRFSYTGFRYVEAHTVDCEVVELSGAFLHSSARVVGRFECSNPLINRIHELILAAIRSNMHSVFTDCPHREKLGWLEQTHLMAPAILYNFDAASLYAKVARDIADAQLDNGCVPTIAPQYTSFKPPWDIFNDSPEWGSAAIVNPWLVYQRTGDPGILRDNYEVMRRYLSYLTTRADGHILNYGLADWYDIGPGDSGFSKLTSAALTATCMYYQNATILACVARAIGHEQDADMFDRLSREIAAAFHAKLFDPATHRYDRGSQTAQAMPLALGLVRDVDRAAVLAHLITDIRSNNNHFTAGDIGLHFVLTALAEAGRSDVIFDALSRTDPPSYGCQIERGATTLTEAWDANPKNSQNHFMLGHVETWFYAHLAGLQVDLSRNDPHERFTIRPNIVGDVDWVRASYECVAGRTDVHWERHGNDVTLNVTVPASATVHVPGEAAGRQVGAGTHSFSGTVGTCDRE